jgi:hypothetical protein
MVVLKVVLTDEQLCFWGGAWAFSPDQHLKMEVRLHRDDGFQGKLQVRYLSANFSVCS